MADHSLSGSLSLEAWQRIEALCRAYEEAWRSGLPPVLQEYLAQVEQREQAALLTELRGIDRHYQGASHCSRVCFTS
jgi:hypothetical protein